MKPAMCRVCGKAEFGHTCAGARLPILMSDQPPSKEVLREAMAQALASSAVLPPKPKRGRPRKHPR
jgi:hypothetical protein